MPAWMYVQCRANTVSFNQALCSSVAEVGGGKQTNTDSNAAGQSGSGRKLERRPAPVCGCIVWSPHSSSQASCSGVRLNCVDPRGALQAGGGMFETGFVVGLGVEGLVVRCARIPGWVSRGSTDSKTVMVFSSVNKKTQVKPPKRWKTLLNGKDKPNSRGWVTCDV